MIYRQRLPLQGIYAANQVAYHFSDQDWQYILYDRDLNEHLYLSNEIPVGTTSNLQITEIGFKRFIYPFPLEGLAKFEGEVNGNVRVKLWSTAVDKFAYLDRIHLSLKVIDSESNERFLVDYGFSANCQADASNSEPLPEDLLAPAFIFFFSIDAHKTDKERLLLDVTLYGHVDDVAETGHFELYCECGKKDLYLDLPVL